MQQVGVPDQHIAPSRLEIGRRPAMALDPLLPIGLKQPLGMGFAAHLCGGKFQLRSAHIGQAVAPRAVDQWPSFRGHILQGHPHAGHEPRRLAVEVGGIAVDGLVAAHRKIKRLKRKRFAAVAAAQQPKDLRMQGQLPHRRSGGIAPGIAQAHARVGAAAPFAQIQQRLQLGKHLIQQRQPMGVAGP